MAVQPCMGWVLIKKKSRGMFKNMGKHNPQRQKSGFNCPWRLLKWWVRCDQTHKNFCKSVQERGCEKSGKIVCFSTYLKDEFGITSIPLFPFLGNRFNILFVNAAGVYFLCDQLIDFFRRIERNNKLLDALYWDLEVLSFKIGCRALGLIEKLITGPLWKIMVNETHILRNVKSLPKFFRVSRVFKWRLQ